MEPAEINLKQVLLPAAAVILIEAAAGLVRADPLLVTFIIRSADLAIILAAVYFTAGDVSVIGLSRHRIREGFLTGICWSVLTGLAVLAVWAVLAAAGISFLCFVDVKIPGTAARTALLFAAGGVIGPAAEEALFRGLIYSYLRRWGVLAALSGSTLLFAASHIPGTGLPLAQAAGGILFGLAYEKSKSLAAPAVIHILGNWAIFSLNIAKDLQLLF